MFGYLAPITNYIMIKLIYNSMPNNIKVNMMKKKLTYAFYWYKILSVNIHMYCSCKVYHLIKIITFEIGCNLCHIIFSLELLNFNRKHKLTTSLNWNFCYLKIYFGIKKKLKNKGNINIKKKREREKEMQPWLRLKWVDTFFCLREMWWVSR